MCSYGREPAIRLRNVASDGDVMHALGTCPLQRCDLARMVSTAGKAEDSCVLRLDRAQSILCIGILQKRSLAPIK